MSFKLTIIGAGSLTFARTLFTDIMSVKELRNIEVAFTDINPDNLDRVTRLCQRDLEANGIPTKIFATTDRREALKGARYIVNCVRIGGLEAFETDIDIPLKYGVDQCVGDTLCVGGIMYGQRGIAAVLDFCRDIREVAEPNALLLNYSNPMAMLTWACIKYGGVRTLGLCHGEIHGEMQIADVLGVKDRKELDVICAGLNHQTWYLSVKHSGQEMIGRLLEGFEKHPEYSRTEKVRIDVLKRFGYYSTESNGHLSEYVAWYRKRPGEIERWIDLSSWINGETGGYLRETWENRNWFETEYPRLMAEPPKRYDGSERSSEHGSYIIEALETGRTYRGHFNVMNHGAISNLPDECVVEVPCYVDGNGISVPVRVGAAAGRGGGRRRRRGAAQAGGADGPAHRRGVQPAGGVADGGRAADRPGGVAAPVCRGHRPGEGALRRGRPHPHQRGLSRRGAPAGQDRRGGLRRAPGTGGAPQAGVV